MYVLSADQTGHIKIQWGARIADTTIRNLSKSLGKVTQVPKTAAYRTTFAHAGILAGMDDVLQAVEEEVATCLTAFAKEHVFADIVTSVGKSKTICNAMVTHAYVCASSSHVNTTFV